MATKKTTYTEIEAVVPIAGEQIDTTLLEPKSKHKGKILMLHGAGESTKDRLTPLARELANLGWSCLTFSLPGHGRSSGKLLGSTLKGRKEMTRHIAEHFKFWPPDIVLGVSMGGHTAISLLEEASSIFNKLVLLVPAAYAEAAEEVPFGAGFTEILRTPHSYRSAKSWDILPNYEGKLVVVEAGNDKVIPAEVHNLIMQSAKKAEFEHLLVKDSEHQISIWLIDNPQHLKDFAKAVDSFDFTEFKANL